eukprot:TRINITY_DN23243_c0_g1_i1.p2 TRINITY_DN23243_c0_g1~~TRINITY_DN23243_c0_g1_i1.p2  ORF type:complete len:299 (+),score=53.49 TRINITY_DN23243_c0_g1_i1:68-964(+)
MAQQSCDSVFLESAIGTLVDEVAEANKFAHLLDEDHPAADFECLHPPAQAFSVYMKRFHRIRMTPALWLQALILVGRLQRSGRCPVNPCTVHRLMATAMTVAVKLSYDCRDAGPKVARFGGVQLAELNDMEETFMKLSDWRVLIWPEEYKIMASSAGLLKAYAEGLRGRTPHPDGAMLIPDAIWAQLQRARDAVAFRPPAGSPARTPRPPQQPRRAVARSCPQLDSTVTVDRPTLRAAYSSPTRPQPYALQRIVNAGVFASLTAGQPLQAQPGPSPGHSSSVPSHSSGDASQDDDELL